MKILNLLKEISKKILWAAGLLLAAATATNTNANALQPFRLHLNTEPSSLKPWEQKNSSAGYFLSQVSGTLLVFQQGTLQPRLAKSCVFKSKKKIDCEILKSATFSDGSPITADSFRKSWVEFLQPKNHAFRADLLFSVKNVEKFFLGQVTEKDLGLASKNNHLIIQLEKEDSDFLYTLTSPLLAPQKSFEFPEPAMAAKWISSGAYVIQSWETQKKIILQHRENKNLKIEFLFVQEDSTALNLYEKGELSFLRRLPTLFIPKFQNRKDFIQVAQNRMDYIGFGPELKNHPELREALTKALDYQEIQKLLFSKGQVGCPGLAEEQQSSSTCASFNVTEAKQKLILAQKRGKPLPHLVYAFSKQGGDDHKMFAEWLQGQWKKNLDLNVELQAIENRMFVDLLKNQPPTMFRKGVNPERPTCLSALEFFTPESSENFLRLDPSKDKIYFSAIQGLQKKSDLTERKKLCTQALQSLGKNYLWIPTGPIHFTLLIKPEWKGWNLNELNQLDLSGLSLSN